MPMNSSSENSEEDHCPPFCHCCTGTSLAIETLEVTKEFSPSLKEANQPRLADDLLTQYQPDTPWHPPKLI